jgi:hypothetical protein
MFLTTDIVNQYGKKKCACCGYFTINEIKETCPVCGWEEDCFQEEHVDDSAGPNHVCLRDAKVNFRQIEASDIDSKNFVRMPKDDEKW